MEQQKSSWAQTQAWIAGSPQPGPSWTSQQSPPPPQGPQSCSQVVQSSSGSHAPSPQTLAGPQSSPSQAQVPWQSQMLSEAQPQGSLAVQQLEVPVYPGQKSSPPPPQSPQPKSSTSPTQTLSHAVAQQ